MATYVWSGSNEYEGGYGHSSFTGGDDYLSGVTTGFSWNVASNWLEEFQGLTGGMTGPGWSGDGEPHYFARSTSIPGAGDTVILKYLNGSNNIMDFPAVGITGQHPRSPLLFGGYHPLSTGVANSYNGGGGWVGADSGKTSGKLALMKVENSYLLKAIGQGITGNGGDDDDGDGVDDYGTHRVLVYQVGRFPLGVKGSDIRRVEIATRGSSANYSRVEETVGGTFSGLQIRAESFLHEEWKFTDEHVGYDPPQGDLPWPITKFRWICDDLQDFGHGCTWSAQEAICQITLIHSIIDVTRLKGWSGLNAYGTTFDQLYVERVTGSGFGEPTGISESDWHVSGGGLILADIPENSIMPGRPNVGSRIIDHADGTGYLLLGGKVGSTTIIKCDETIPKIDVTAERRRMKFWIDAPTITTLNLYPEGHGGGSVRPNFDGYGEFQPVVLTNLASGLPALASFTTVTNCNLEAYNPSYSNSVECYEEPPNYDYEPPQTTPQTRGTHNRLAINKGVTFDNLNIKGGRVYVGILENQDDAGQYPPTYLTQGMGSDMGQIRVNAGEMHSCAYLNCNHPSDSDWRRFEIGGCVSPCTVAGMRIFSEIGHIKYLPDSYIVAGQLSSGATSGVGITPTSK